MTPHHYADLALMAALTVFVIALVHLLSRDDRPEWTERKRAAIRRQRNRLNPKLARKDW